LQHTATHCNTPAWGLRQKMRCNTLATHTTIHCNTLQHTATHCNTLQFTATPHPETHCNTTATQLPHTAKHGLGDFDGRYCHTFAKHCSALQHSTLKLIATPPQHHCKTLAWGLRRQVLQCICNTLQHSATYCDTARCNKLQHHCNTLQQHCNNTATPLHHTGLGMTKTAEAATNCNALQHICNTLQHSATRHTATHCNTLQHTATHCHAPQQTATQYNTLQHTATHCNTKHCNTLQHTTTQHNATHCNTTHCNTGNG